MRYEFAKREKRELLEGHLHLGTYNPKEQPIQVNSAYFLRGGKPWIPIMGEFHFSRYERAGWREELCKMKAGGITVVSTYLFWNHHEEREGEVDFTGNRDIRGFVEECGDQGLFVMLRIGPWVHGECRNGGFPDWLLRKPCALRSNDPEYLAQVRRWYSQIAAQVKGLLYRDGGSIAAIQLENEYVDDAEHLMRLKEIAIACGLQVPVYTVTGWGGTGGAKIPVDEVVPVFGGYCEEPWTERPGPLPPCVHYFFNQTRNDTAIGEDLLPRQAETDWELPYERYPFATCELGAGIQVTHHRRPLIRPMDIYAMALVKLGEGNNLPGYYMYHGGTNPLGRYSTLQESRASGYPNDYPILSYDFQAPLSEYGEVREQYRLLNLLHLFLQDFGEEFAPLEAVDALRKPGRRDVRKLRYGMRTDGRSGYVFVNHYQRLTALADIEEAVIDTGSVVFPPLAIRGPVSFFLPFEMKLGGSIALRWATAQPLCRVDSTYFFLEIPGIAARYCFEDGAEQSVEAGIRSAFSREDVTIVTLPMEQARYLRRLEGKLYLGAGCDLYLCGGQLKAVQEGDFEAFRWETDEFLPVSSGQRAENALPGLAMEELREAPFVPPYGEELQLGGPRELSWKRLHVTGESGFVEIAEACDAAQIYVDGKLAADNFYYGRPWRVPVKLLKGKECFLVTSSLRDDFYREF